MRGRIFRTIAILGLAAFLFSLGSPAFQVAAGSLNQAKPPTSGEFIPGQILVRFRPGLSEERRAEILSGQAATRLRRVPALDVEVLELPVQLPIERAVEIFSHLPDVEYAEPNYLIHIAQTSEPWEDKQWAPQKIQAPMAWAEIPNPAPVTIAIVDTGVDYRHSQLQPNMYTNTGELGGNPGVDDDGNGRIDDIHGTDFVNNDGDPMDDHSHGTHVAGLAAATRGTTLTSMTGICPFCKIMAVKVLGADGSGSLDVVANGIVYAADNGARVINLSLGSGLRATTLQNAVDYAWSQGSIVVAAAGNNGADLRFYPAAYPNAIAVAATNDQDYRSCFSNYGNFTDPFVNVAAPGEGNYSTIPVDASGNDQYAVFSGTSMATPHVSGLAGLLLAQEPSRTNAAVRDLIEGTTEDLGPVGADPFFGTGRINAYRAVTNNQLATDPPDGLFTTSLTGSGYAHARKLAREAGGKLHLVWHTQESGIYRVRHATSSDNGASWSLEPDVYSGSLETYHPAVALDDQYLYVAYPQRTNSTSFYQTFFTRKPLTGGAWSSPVSLLGGTYHAVRPDLYQDSSNGRLHIVASSLDDAQFVYYRASDDEGSNWTPIRSVNPSTSTTVSNTRYATVHANGDNIYIAARTLVRSFFTTLYLHTVRSIDGGATWFDQTKISSYIALTSGEYGVSLSGIADRLYMGYEVGSGSGGGLYFRRYDGAGWSDYLLLETAGIWPTITQAGDGQAWMMWENGGSILMRHYDGSTWEPAQTLLPANSFSKGYFPNLKLGTSGERLEWVYTHCSGAPFRLEYGRLDLGPPPTETPPAAPSNLAATAPSSSDIELSWTDNATDENGFKIERSPGGNTGWVQVAEVGSNITNTTNTGLTAGTSYFYRVGAFNDAGDSGYSNVASATTQALPPPPSAPTNLTAEAQSSATIELSWTDSSGDESGFRIERSPDGAGNWAQIAEVSANVTTSVDTGLAASTAYYYRVYAFNSNGSSEPSNVASATTYAPPTVLEFTVDGETTLFGTRSGDYNRTFSNDGTDESITEIESGGRPANRYSYLEHRWVFNVQPGNLATVWANAWGSSSGDGETFRFEYSLDDDQYTPMFTLTAGSDTSTYDTYTLPSSISGTVWVRVVDTDRTPGNRTLDTVFIDHLFIRVETAPGNPPSAPASLAAVAVSDSQIDLSWTDTSSDELGFRVERSLDGNSWQTATNLNANTTAYSDSGLQANSLYSYRVLAYNASGVSGPSNTASATTQPAIQVEIHVGDLDGSSAPGRTGRWDATVTITVHSDDESPVPGVTVEGIWSAGASGAGTCVTNIAGSCDITKTSIKTSVTSVLFSVSGVSLEDTVYASPQNHDPESDSDGSSISVNQP